MTVPKAASSELAQLMLFHVTDQHASGPKDMEFSLPVVP